MSKQSPVIGDLLTSYNEQPITYDAIGNPIEYRDGMSMEWSNGRQLDSLTQNGKTVEYTYDNDGMRLTKTEDGVKYTYLYENGLLVQKPMELYLADLIRIQKNSSTQNTARVLGAFVYKFEMNDACKT